MNTSRPTGEKALPVDDNSALFPVQLNLTYKEGHLIHLFVKSINHSLQTEASHADDWLEGVVIDITDPVILAKTLAQRKYPRPWASFSQKWP